MVPGKVESWIVIADCAEVWATALSNTKLQTMVTIMQQNYPGRLYKLFAINVSFTLRAIWTVLSNFIDSFTENKIKIFSDDYHDALFEIVDQEMIEQKFGGKLPNKTEAFYPPKFE
jgi:hypothetical protein